MLHKKGGTMLKCCLHSHTVNSDGSLRPRELLRYLKKVGYNVVAITDHNYITKVHPADIPRDMVVLEGYEWTFQIHIVKIEPMSLEEPETSIIDWLAHPARWRLSQKQIEHYVKSFKLDGAEQYNRGRKHFEDNVPFLKFAVDDFHSPEMELKSWIEVDVPLNAQDILGALKKGDFYMRKK